MMNIQFNRPRKLVGCREKKEKIYTLKDNSNSSYVIQDEESECSHMEVIRVLGLDFPDNCPYINIVTSTATRTISCEEYKKLNKQSISSLLIILFLQTAGCQGYMGMNEFSREENMQKMFEDRDNIEEEDEEEAKEDTIMEKADAIINNHNDNNNSNHTEEKVRASVEFVRLSRYLGVKFTKC